MLGQISLAKAYSLLANLHVRSNLIG